MNGVVAYSPVYCDSLCCCDVVNNISRFARQGEIMRDQAGPSNLIIIDSRSTSGLHQIISKTLHGREPVTIFSGNNERDQ